MDCELLSDEDDDKLQNARQQLRKASKKGRREGVDALESGSQTRV